MDLATPPSEDQIIAALAQHFQAPQSAAIAWLAAIKLHFDPKAAAERLAERNATLPPEHKL